MTAVVSNKPNNSVVQLAADYFDNGFDLAIGETDRGGRGGRGGFGSLL